MSGNSWIALRYLISPTATQSLKNHLAFFLAAILKPQFTLSKVTDAFSEARAIHHIYWNIILTLSLFGFGYAGAGLLGLIEPQWTEIIFFPLFLISAYWMAYALFYGFSVFILQSQASTRRHLAAFSSISSTVAALSVPAIFALSLSSASLSVLILLITAAPVLVLASFALSHSLGTNQRRASLSKNLSFSTLGVAILAFAGLNIFSILQSDKGSEKGRIEILSDRSAIKLHCEGRISLGKELQGCVQFPDIKQNEQEKLTKSYCDQYVEQGKIKKGPCPIQQTTSACRSNLGGAEIYSYDGSDALKVHCSDLKMGTFVVLDPTDNKN